jgi:hypothetical protein
VANDDKTGKRADEKIVDEARKRFEQCAKWENQARTRFVADVKFCEGDSDNGYQWDRAVFNSRTTARGGPRPCLTINKTRQYCLQIINDGRQNKAGIQIRPVGDGATYEAAKIFEGICRHIEYRSNAQIAYDTASWHQIVGGIGYWRVLTEYEADDSFDQEVKIQRISDPMSVYLDPDIHEYDGSDARYGFVFRDIPRDQFEAEYPDVDIERMPRDSFGDMEGPNDMGRGDDWENQDYVRVAEYWRKSDKEDTLLRLADNSTAMKSQLPEGMYDQAKARGFIVAERQTTSPEIEWFKLCGRKVIERKDWPGRYVPIVRVVGEETIIDRQLDRHGHTRSLKDPQRMYNWQSSTMVEILALQSKSPWVGPKETFEGLEQVWNNANQENVPYLVYNNFDEQGRELPKPERQIPGQMGPAVVQAMQIAQNEMMMASGQYQAQMGENENAKSGVAIQQRQRQGDNATYHYIDHLAQAIRYTGRILVDLIPKIYDTERAIKIMAEDGDQSEVHIDPNAPQPQMQVGPGGQPLNPQQAAQMQQHEAMADKVKVIFNPTIGKYDVEADIGPAFATKRQEAFNAYSQMMMKNGPLMQLAGDILFKNMDTPGADEIAERLKRAVPPNILGTGPDPHTQQLQQQNQQLQTMVQGMNQKLLEAESKIKKGNDDSEIKIYDAETRRMAAISKADAEAFKPVIRSLISEALGTPIVPIMHQHAAEEQAMAPQEPQPETVQ